MTVKVDLRSIKKCLCGKEATKLHPITFAAQYSAYLCDRCFYREIAQRSLEGVHNGRR